MEFRLGTGRTRSPRLLCPFMGDFCKLFPNLQIAAFYGKLEETLRRPQAKLLVSL
jgi:hypothetical protein